MPIGQTIGLLVIPLVLGIVFFNGVVMLVSPARWFTLPRYIALRGTLRQHDYMSTRFGRLRIRALGLVFAGLTGWMDGWIVFWDSSGFEVREIRQRFIRRAY